MACRSSKHDSYSRKGKLCFINYQVQSSCKTAHVILSDTFLVGYYRYIWIYFGYVFSYSASFDDTYGVSGATGLTISIFKLKGVGISQTQLTNAKSS